MSVDENIGVFGAGVMCIVGAVVLMYLWSRWVWDVVPAFMALALSVVGVALCVVAWGGGDGV